MSLETRRLEPGELELAIRRVDPAVALVSGRTLRRIIKLHSRLLSLGLRVPHRKALVIRRDALLDLVSPEELDLPAGDQLPETLVLLPRPTAQMLQSLPAGQVLLKWWRLLFHARVHRALDEQSAAGRWGPHEAEQAIRRIGGPEWDEALLVLRQEELLLPPRSASSMAAEFAAVYLELRWFASDLAPIYFPGLRDLPQIDEIWQRQLDAEALFQATRPSGASSPSEMAQRAVERIPGPFPDVDAPRVDFGSQRIYERLISRANRARELGNLVRSALLRTSAAAGVGGELAKDTLAAAADDIVSLVKRLATSIRLPAGELDDWNQCLTALTAAASHGRWSNEARLLYDLQKACLDSERGIYALDLWRWLKSFGRAPLKRPLPGQREVLISMRLHRAATRLSTARLPAALRDRLDSILHVAARRAELHLRARLRPILTTSLEDEQLVPQNLPETVARNKLVDELLDRVVERGFIAMSDLRDSLSRNQLKLPDLSSPAQLLTGDQLLRVDERLAERLDGVYRPGEAYLRGPQRVSSVAFGTPLGRFVTRFVLLPFGSAYVALAGLDHLIAILVGRLAPAAEPAEGTVGPADLLLDAATAPAELAAQLGQSSTTPSHGATYLATPWILLTVGLLLVGLINHRGFRAQCGRAAKWFGRGLRHVLYVWPSQIAALPAVQRLISSPQYRFALQFLIKPLTGAMILTWLLPGSLADSSRWQTGLALFLGANLLLNSRLGRNVEEVVSDWLLHAWRRIRIHVVASLFRFIVDLFHGFLEFTERLLYSVDEWLRFRSGERRELAVLKTVLGVIWAGVNYVLRFCINLLIEPQINPIKHFPVVTVSHKILLPTIPTLAFVLENHFHFGKTAAVSLATTIIFGIPGIFGFLVWELKENWRLYAANRPPELQPVHVGRHNETLPQLLRLGFHSGRIPKLFARARKAARKAYWTNDWKPVQKQLSGVHQQEDAVRRFVDRELAAILRLSRGWGGLEISCGMIHLGCNRILCELYCGALGEDSPWVSFVERGGALIAEIPQPGWLGRLSGAQRATFGNAVAGFYKLAGVDLVREQIESQWLDGDGRLAVRPADAAQLDRTGKRHPGSTPRRLGDSGLPGSPDGGSEAGIARSPAANARRRAEAIPPAETVFARAPITWRTWVVVWDLDQLHGVSQQEILDRRSLLPN